MMGYNFQNFIPSTNKQETDNYHSLEFVHCSDRLFQPIFGRFFIRNKLVLVDFSADLGIGQRTESPKNDQSIRTSASFSLINYFNILYSDRFQNNKNQN